MTLPHSEKTRPAQSYVKAIETLDAIIALIDKPGEGLGHDWGLQRGQWGHVELARARDVLTYLRDSMVAHNV